MLTGVYNALAARASELGGTRASTEEVQRLAERFPDACLEPLLAIYRELPICGVALQFSVKPAGVPAGPRTDSEDESEYDHEFGWMIPQHIIEEIDESHCGRLVLAAGYFPIGLCAFGGNTYFIRPFGDKPELTLYQLYYDWIDEDVGPPLVPDAVHVVADSLENVIRVASLVRA